MQISEDVWQKFHGKLKNKRVIKVLHGLFDHIVKTFSKRIDSIKIEEGVSIAFFSGGREFLTINVTRYDLRIYIHPAARVYFDPGEKFEVENFRFWDASLQKRTGKYRGMSVWISDIRFMQGVKDILKLIPASSETEEKT